VAEIAQPRSWLFAPGHDEKLLRKVFEVGADAVILDLEDAVPADLKDRARDMVAAVAASRLCWVRVNRAQTEECERDLAAVADKVSGIRSYPSPVGVIEILTKFGFQMDEPHIKRHGNIHVEEYW